MKKICFLFPFLVLIYVSVFAEGLQNSQDTKLYTRDIRRTQPLPFLDLKSSIESGKLLLDIPLKIPVKYDLSPKTTIIVKDILKSIFQADNAELKPEINPEDLVTSANSEEYQLKRILESDFKEQNWQTAYDLITNFLSVEHSKGITTKAHYYRAQVLFFQDKYRESFMEFTLVQDEMPLKIKKWMDTILNYLQEDN